MDRLLDLLPYLTVTDLVAIGLFALVLIACLSTGLVPPTAAPPRLLWMPPVATEVLGLTSPADDEPAAPAVPGPGDGPRSCGPGPVAVPVEEPAPPRQLQLEPQATRFVFALAQTKQYLREEHLRQCGADRATSNLLLTGWLEVALEELAAETSAAEVLAHVQAVLRGENAEALAGALIAQQSDA